MFVLYIVTLFRKPSIYYCACTVKTFYSQFEACVKVKFDIFRRVHNNYVYQVSFKTMYMSLVKYSKPEIQVNRWKLICVTIIWLLFVSCLCYRVFIFGFIAVFVVFLFFFFFVLWKQVGGIFQFNSNVYMYKDDATQWILIYNHKKNDCFNIIKI